MTKAERKREQKLRDMIRDAAEKQQERADVFSGLAKDAVAGYERDLYNGIAIRRWMVKFAYEAVLSAMDGDYGALSCDCGNYDERGEWTGGRK